MTVTSPTSNTPPLPPFHGWLPDAQDARDYVYEAPTETLATLPANADLRGQFPPVFHQGHLHSCTVQAVAAVIPFLQGAHRQPETGTVSRLFMYYNARKLRGTEGVDDGAHLRDVLKSVNMFGVCDEAAWPYPWPRPADLDQMQALAAVRPPDRCYQGAKRYQLKYQRLRRSLP